MTPSYNGAAAGSEASTASRALRTGSLQGVAHEINRPTFAHASLTIDELIAGFVATWPRSRTTDGRKDFRMSTTSTRVLLGFLAGALSNLLFQGGFGAILYVADLLPALPWSLTPVPPLGVPRIVSMGFWAGLWGLAYAMLEPRLTARLGWLVGGLVFGLALPLVAYWFVVQPLKGFGIGGGFLLAMVPIEVGFHAAYGIGTAIIFRAGLALVRRQVRASPAALNG
jgi:hypothetical protein